MSKIYICGKMLISGQLMNVKYGPFIDGRAVERAVLDVWHNGQFTELLIEEKKED